jgi:multidrug efflux pump subunit AcrA (membrane-fusion protein)
MFRFHELIREGKIRSARDEGADIHVQLRKADDIDGAFPYDGTINFVDNQINTGTGTITIRAKFDNPKAPGSSLRPFAKGVFVEVRVPVGPEHAALVLPQAAIGTDQGEKYVFAIDAQNKIEYRPVAVGAVQSGGRQEVIPRKIVRTSDGVRLAEVGEQGEDSITKSDRIVVSGLQRIRTGMDVNPQAYAAPLPTPTTAPQSPPSPAASPSATAK